MTLTDREIKHLKTVVAYLHNDERKDYENQGQPADHIFESVLGLQEVLLRSSPTLPIPDENDYGFNRDGQNDGKDGPDINWRWAKETVGLVALELNEAYKQFEVSDEGWNTPSGSLQCAAKLLNEAMKRLGIVDPDGEIPF